MRLSRMGFLQVLGRASLVNNEALPGDVVLVCYCTVSFENILSVFCLGFPWDKSAMVLAAVALPPNGRKPI